MSDLFFNIRYKTTHYQLTKNLKFRKSENIFHAGNPRIWGIYCVFGLDINKEFY